MKKYAFFILTTALLSGSATTSTLPVRPGKDFALFFAVNDYDHWEDLANPISDVEAIAKDLKDLYGFETEVVRNPDRKTILDKIEVYRQKTYDKEAQLLIFFSGHGEFNEATKQGYFVPKNGQKNDAYGDSYIEYEGLKRRISSLPCEHILLALDACYSGTADESIAMRGEPGKRPGASADAERERYISTSLQYKTRLMLTSGAKVRTPDKSQFVAKFLVALRSQGGDDRLINMPELLGYLTTATPKPVSSSFGEHAPGGEFLFIKAQYTAPKDLATKSDNTSKKEQDLAAWRAAKSSNTLAAYQKYLADFPGGEFRAEANEAIQKMETDLAQRQDDLAWNITTEKNTLEAYKKYQTDYPKGRHYAEAAVKIKAIDQPVATEKTYEVIDIVKPPGFPGGEQEMLKFISENLKYPDLARENNIQGVVVLTFIVDKSGQVKDVQIAKDIGGYCGKEAVRIVQAMPKWTPGEIKGGVPVNVRFTLPVRFRLE